MTKPVAPAVKKPSLLRTVKAIAWSFEEDIKNLSPLHIIAVGLAGIFVFVAVLVLLVNWAVTH